MKQYQTRSKQLKSVAVITKAITKKGKLKGKNKKETKLLKEQCVHHSYTKKGKLKPEFFNTHKGMCACELCKATFQTKVEDKESVKEMVTPVLGLANQSVAASVAAGLGERSVDKLISLKVLLAEFPKDYNKIMKAVSKSEAIKKKKNRRKNNTGSAQYGTWGRN